MALLIQGLKDVFVIMKPILRLKVKRFNNRRVAQPLRATLSSGEEVKPLLGFINEEPQYDC